MADPVASGAAQADSAASLEVENLSIEALKPHPNNSRTHPKRQVEQIAASIREFGFTNPILVDKHREVVAGHGRLLAAKKLGPSTVPVITLGDLSPTQIRALRLADNTIALNAGWDVELLRIELGELGGSDLSIDLGLTGFSPGEIDVILSSADDPDDEVVPATRETPRTSLGDIWQLGEHRIGCGDGRDADFLRRVVGATGRLRVSGSAVQRPDQRAR